MLRVRDFLSICGFLSIISSTIAQINCGNPGFPGSPMWQAYWDCFNSQMRDLPNRIRNPILPELQEPILFNNNYNFNNIPDTFPIRVAPPPTTVMRGDDPDSPPQMNCGSSGAPWSPEWNPYWICFNAHMETVKEFCRKHGKTDEFGNCVYNGGSSSTNIQVNL